jgi:hypothetical protein
VGDRGGQLTQHAHAVDVREIRLELPQPVVLGFGPLALRYIYCGAQEPNDFSRIIHDGVPDRVEVLHRTVRHHQPELDGRVHPFPQRLLMAGLQPVPVFRVSAPEERLLGQWWLWRIGPEDPQALLRQVYVLGPGHVERPAPGVAQTLRLGQVGLALPQGVLGPLALGDVPDARAMSEPRPS